MHALFSEKVAFPKLEKMIIQKLRNVKMMFHNYFAPGSFQNLRKIRVEGCGSLKNLFPVSIAKDLPQLEDLYITNCGVEKIVSKGEGAEEQPVRFEFSQVSSLEVTSLKELKCFYEGQHTIVWPVLKKLKTDCSALLKIVASEHLRLIQGNEQPVLLVEEVLKAGLQCNMEPEACYYRDQQLSSSAHFAWCARMVFRPNEATDIAVLF